MGCFRSQGKLTASLSTNGQVFEHGGTLLAKIEMQNRHWRRRRKVARFSLIQNVLFHSHTLFNALPENRSTQREIEMFKLNIPRRGQSITENVKIKLARNLAPTSKSPAMITVSYILKLDLGNLCELVLPIAVVSDDGTKKSN
ncbi:unnamed protein product [Soboliphyme baturini]|uniref:Arrestin_C domain-containing protein n=1 Tax=Soboliphyme baturini TaxID=241478 RepID=A0A183J3L3_9BILA|nr:unnamed protein product [Soboliphyme baturini]